MGCAKSKFVASRGCGGGTGEGNGKELVETRLLDAVQRSACITSPTPERQYVSGACETSSPKFLSVRSCP